MARMHKLDSNRGRTPNLPGYFTRLPPVCEEPIPEWPLLREPASDHQEYWERLWRSPQATLWHRTRSFIVVARYVELLAVERPTAGQLGEIRQMEDRLALTPKAMYALYVVVDDDVSDMKPPTKLSENQEKRLANRPKVFTG